jgi:hypothetical protein
MPSGESQPATLQALTDARTLPTPLNAVSHAWQATLLEPAQLATFVSDRGVSVSEEDIRGLWQLRLLRADLVASRRKFKLVGLKYLRTDRMGWHWYADHRDLAIVRETQSRPRTDGSARSDRVVLLFHPFRFYVLYHVTLARQPSFTVMESLFGLQMDDEFNRDWNAARRRWFASSRFLHSLTRWHDVAGLAIALEPVFYAQLFGVFRHPGSITARAQQRAIDQHWSALRSHILPLKVETLEEVRRQLSFDAERLDGNTDLHVLIRLADSNLRERLRDAVGGATVLLTMAEMFRRAWERVHRSKLPEEDALVGSRAIRENAKKLLFGSTRILDDQKAAREFVRHHNLHVGVRVRWYVEGETETAIVQELLQGAGAAGIELVNLRGQFIEKNAVAFRGYLQEDKRLGIFSFILIDGDTPANLRVLNRAAADDLICGRVFVSVPDVEFANFDCGELADVLWTARDPATPEGLRSTLDDAVASANSGKSLLQAAKNALHPYLEAADKGEAWGRSLGRLAAERPKRGDAFRPIYEAFRLAVMFPRQSHDWTMREYRIDPNSLLPVKRVVARRVAVRRTRSRRLR